MERPLRRKEIDEKGKRERGNRVKQAHSIQPNGETHVRQRNRKTAIARDRNRRTAIVRDRNRQTAIARDAATDSRSLSMPTSGQDDFFFHCCDTRVDDAKEIPDDFFPFQLLQRGKLLQGQTDGWAETSRKKK